MENHLDWVCGDAMCLPFKDNSFDVYTISFGIRNVTHPEKALSEALQSSTARWTFDGIRV